MYVHILPGIRVWHNKCIPHIYPHRLVVYVYNIIFRETKKDTDDGMRRAHFFHYYSKYTTAILLLLL